MLFVGEGETSNTDDVDTRGSRFDDTFDPKPRAATWPMLRSLTCVGGDLTEVDASVRLCPRLRRLDLRRNGVERIDPDGTRCLSELTHLDLGFNRVRDARWLPDALHADGRVLTSLSLRGNKLRSARGLETLTSLESLDVAGNLLRSMKHDVAFIADNLPRLRKVWLEGNPVSAVAGYRTQALACWPDTRAVELDGRPASKFDKFTLRHYRKATQLKGADATNGGDAKPRRERDRVIGRRNEIERIGRGTLHVGSRDARDAAASRVDTAAVLPRREGVVASPPEDEPSRCERERIVHRARRVRGGCRGDARGGALGVRHVLARLRARTPRRRARSRRRAFAFAVARRVHDA